MDQQPINRCTDCGKQFRDIRDLNRHKSRKTPCVILDKQNDNNRCIHCNKVYSSKSNLTKHIKNCARKNGGIEELPDNIQLIERLRIIQEEQAKEREERVREREEQVRREEAYTRELEKQRQEYIELKQMITAAIMTKQPSTNTVNGDHATIINGDVITVNKFTSPNIQYYKESPEKMRGMITRLDTDLHMHLIKSTWFNNEHPENHAIMANSNGTCQVMGDYGWEPMSLDAAAEEVHGAAIDIAVNLITEITPDKRDRASVLKNSKHVKNRLREEEVAKVREDMICGTKFISGDKKSCSWKVK